MKRKLDQYKQMLNEVDELLKHSRKESALMSFCDGLDKPVEVCRRQCIFFKSCPVGLNFPGVKILLKNRSQIVKGMDDIAPDWREIYEVKDDD